MQFLNRNRLLTLALLASLPLLSRTAHAYVDLAPTFSKIVADSPAIALVEVTAFDPKTHIVTLKPVQTLKGTVPADAINHEVAPTGGTSPRQIVQWAVPGSRGVLFASRT